LLQDVRVRISAAQGIGNNHSPKGKKEKDLSVETIPHYNSKA